MKTPTKNKNGAQLNLIVPEAVKRSFKAIAAQMGLTLQDAGIKALQDFMESRKGKSSFNHPTHRLASALN